MPAENTACNYMEMNPGAMESGMQLVNRDDPASGYRRGQKDFHPTAGRLVRGRAGRVLFAAIGRTVVKRNFASQPRATL